MQRLLAADARNTVVMLLMEIPKDLGYPNTTLRHPVLLYGDWPLAPQTLDTHENYCHLPGPAVARRPRIGPGKNTRLLVVGSKYVGGHHARNVNANH